MLTEYRNENLAEMLENVKTDVNSVTLLRTVMRAIIELCEAACHVITVSLTDYLDKRDSEVKKEDKEKEKREREMTVKKRKKTVKRRKRAVKRVRKVRM